MGHPSEVDEIFDAISYSKGASVIRMLHNYIGDEVGGLTSSEALYLFKLFDLETLSTHEHRLL